MNTSPLVSAARDLCAALKPARFLSDTVACVYNPLEYAAGPHETYLRSFGGEKNGVFSWA